MRELQLGVAGGGGGGGHMPPLRVLGLRGELGQGNNLAGGEAACGDRKAGCPLKADGAMGSRGRGAMMGACKRRPAPFVAVSGGSCRCSRCRGTVLQRLEGCFMPYAIDSLHRELSRGSEERIEAGAGICWRALFRLSRSAVGSWSKHDDGSRLRQWTWTGGWTRRHVGAKHWQAPSRLDLCRSRR